MQALHIISEINFVYILTNKSWEGLPFKRKIILLHTEKYMN